MMSVGQVAPTSGPAPEAMAETPQKKQVLGSIENILETPQKGHAISIKTGVLSNEDGPGEHVHQKIDFRNSNTCSTFASEPSSTDESEQGPACLNRRASGLIQSAEGVQQTLDHSMP